MLRFASDVDEVVAGLDEVGYAIVEDALSPDQVAATKAEMRRVLDETPYGRNDFEGFGTKRVYALFGKTRAWDGPATSDLVLGVLDRVLGPAYQLSAPTGIEIGPDEKAQVIHRDDSIYPLPRPHGEVVLNTMWPLDDFTEENGATRIIPGSHRSHDHPGPGAATIAAEMRAGSVMFYLGSVWHGGGANRTDTTRLGVILEYVAGWLRPQENHLLAVPRDVAIDLPQRLQELLGYNIYPPFVGYVDGRHPRRALEEAVRGDQ